MADQTPTNSTDTDKLTIPQLVVTIAAVPVLENASKYLLNGAAKRTASRALVVAA